jgi:hypothetical protein
VLRGRCLATNRIKLLLIAFFLLIAVDAKAQLNATSGGNPCQNPYAQLLSVVGTTSGTSLTQIIAPVSGKQIYLCSVTFTTISGITPTYGLEYGTDSNCGTGTTVLVGAPSAAVTLGTIFNYYQAFIVPAGNALCYKSGGTTPVFQYAINYVQQQ